MQVLSALVFSSLLVAGANELAEAKKALEAARANLTKTIARAEVDPPAIADLDAAAAAINALKVVLDKGAAFEPQDLDYAKAALAARKDLRKHREYIEDRRAKVDIHNLWRELERALAAIKDADEVAKLIAAGEKLAPRDQKFAAYLAEAKQALDRHFVAKQTKKVDEARAALDNALAALAPGQQATDAQLDAADRAALELEKRLEEGAVLEKDATYRAHAEKHRAALKAARDRTRAAWTEAGLSRLKAELDPLRADLTQAAQSLRGKNVTAEQIQEARTAAIVAAKVLEKFQLAIARSPALTDYAREVKKTLLEVEVDLQRRSLEPHREAVGAAMKAIASRNAADEAFVAAEAAVAEAQKTLEAGARLERDDRTYAAFAGELRRKWRENAVTVGARRLEIDVVRGRTAIDAARVDVARALIQIEKRSPSDEIFAEAESAVTVLEKTLETVTTKDPTLSQHVRDMHALVKTSRAAIHKRKIAVAIERQKERVERARAELSTVPNVTADDLKDTDAAIAHLAAVLAEGNPLTAEDRAYQAYDREVKKRIEEAKARVARRRLELDAKDGRARLEELSKATKLDLELAKDMESTELVVARASDDVKALAAALERGVTLEAQDKAYASYAARVREELERFKEELELAKRSHAFRKATVEALSLSASAAEVARKSQDLRAQKEKFEAAMAQLRSCQISGEKMLAEHDGLAAIRLIVDGKKSEPKEVIALCAERSAATEQELKEVVGLLSFEEGPKRSYEKGKTLLGQQQKKEALVEFEECLSSGKIIQYKHPELKDRKFDVASAKMTLAELIAACTMETKKIRGK